MRPIPSLVKFLFLGLAAFAMASLAQAAKVNGTGVTPLSYQVIAGSTPKSWAVTTGNLPPGLLLNTLTGLLTGVPGAADTIPATIPDGTTAQDSVTFTISAVPSYVASPAVVREPFIPPSDTVGLKPLPPSHRL